VYARRWSVPLAAGLFIAALASPIAAQAPPVFELPDVIAPGRRVQPRASTPASISVLTAEDLARLGVRTVGDALRFLPEVSVRSFGGLGAQQEISIRGTGSPHVLVLLDGIPINSPALGLVGLQTLPVDNVERIEVLRGPFSAIYGSGALGGVINIVSRSRPRRALRAGGGTAGTTTAAVMWGWEAERTRLSVTATHDATAGFRANSDYSGQTFAGRLTFAPDAQQGLSLGLSRYQDRQGVPGSTAFPSPLARQTIGRTIADATWRASAGATSSALIRAYWVDEAITFADPTFASSDLTRAYTLGLEGQRVRSLSPSHMVTLGFEIQQQAIDARFSSSFGETLIRRDATVGAAYAVSDLTLGPATLLSTALRYDVHSVYGGALNPRVGIVHQLDDRTVLRAGVGSTFRGPTFLLLFFPGCSNPALRPERAWSADAGIERVIAPGLVARATVFATRASDLIASGCPPFNVNTATILGGSAELDGAVASQLRVRAHVSLTGARDQAGDPLIRVPDVTAGAALHYALNASSTLSALVHYTGARPDLDFSTFPAGRVTLPSYIVVGLRYTVSTGFGTLQVGIDNLFDAAYEALRGFPAPGRSVFITFGTGR